MRVSAHKCANPECHVEFKRLGTGRIFLLQVSKPQAWGLPAHIKQKIAWLCPRCALIYDVEFDQQHYQVSLVNREQARRKTA